MQTQKIQAYDARLPHYSSSQDIKKKTKRELKSFELKDEIHLNVAVPSTTRVQLPISTWMSVRARDMVEDNKLRVDFEVEKFEFKATASIAPGATLAVGGPPFQDGWLILAVTRPKK